MTSRNAQPTEVEMPKFTVDMTPEEMGLTRTCGTCKAKPGVACVIRRRGDELRMHGTRQMLGVGSYNRWRYGPNGPS